MKRDSLISILPPIGTALLTARLCKRLGVRGSSSTAIVAANWHYLEYYLSEYIRLPFNAIGKWEKVEGSPKRNPQREIIATPFEMGLQPDSKGQITIIIFDAELAPFNESPELA